MFVSPTRGRGHWLVSAHLSRARGEPHAREGAFIRMFGGEGFLSGLCPHTPEGRGIQWGLKGGATFPSKRLVREEPSEYSLKARDNRGNNADPPRGTR